MTAEMELPSGWEICSPTRAAGDLPVWITEHPSLQHAVAVGTPNTHKAALAKTLLFQPYGTWLFLFP